MYLLTTENTKNARKILAKMYSMPIDEIKIDDEEYQEVEKYEAFPDVEVVREDCGDECKVQRYDYRQSGCQSIY